MFVTFLASVFWRPHLGLYLLVLTLPLQTGRSRLHDFFLGAQFLDILLLGSILGMLIRNQSLVPTTTWNRFFAALALFYYLSLWQGAFFTDVPFPIWITDQRFSNWKNYVEMFLLALVVASSFREKSEIRNLILVMCVSVLVVNRGFYSLMSGRDLSHFSYDVRDAGPLGYAGVNGLAAFEAMFSSFLLGVYSFTRSIKVKIGIVLLLVTCLYCLLYAFSRGGYVGIIVGLITVGLLRKPVFLVAAAAILISWQALLPAAVQERINMTSTETMDGLQLDHSAEDRILLWDDAMKLFVKNPVTGLGFDTYETLGRIGGYRDTHNYYIKILVETGVIGMLLYLALLWKLFRSGISLLHGSDDPFWKAIGLGFVAMIASAIVMNFFGDRWTYQQVDGYLWILLGIVVRGLIVLREEQAEKEEGAAASMSPAPEQLAAVHI